MNRIIWGMPSLTEFPGCEENLRLCSELGLAFVELNMNLPMYQAENLPGFAAVADEYGVGLTIHMDDDFRPADFNELVAEAYLETMRRTICAANLVHAPAINLHMHRGIYFTLPDKKEYVFERYRDRYLSSMRRLRSLCEEEAGEGLQICIENTNGYLPFQQEAVDLLLESPVFALTWDIGHSAGCKDGMDDEAFILVRKDKLRHFHIHDAVGPKCHLVLGTGETDIPEKLRLAHECGARCVLETKTAQALRESVEWLKARGLM